MRVVHLAERIAPFGSDAVEARAVAELPLAQQGGEFELMVIGAAPVTAVEDFKSSQQFARRLEPLVVSDPAGDFEAAVLESTLTGTGIRLYLLVLPPDRAESGFAPAAQALLRTLPEAPQVLHLHQDTGLDPDALRGEIEGVAVIQSVYQPRGTEALAAAVQDADEVVTPCGDLAEAAGGANGSAVGRALQEHARLRVVQHGVDLQRWDPTRDSALSAGFDTVDTEGKQACKKALQEQAGLAPRADVPLIALWSDGGPDSGLGLVAEHLEGVLALDVQLVVVTPGGDLAGDTAGALAAAGERVWLVDASDGRLLRQVLAGADVVLLPDRRAPLGQRASIAARYGLVPVARRVNAHRDRLVEYDGLSNTGGAFLFDEPEAEELMAALGRMRRTFGASEVWSEMVRANGAAELGWSRAVAQLQDIYRKALAK